MEFRQRPWLDALDSKGVLRRFSGLDKPYLKNEKKDTKDT